MSTRALSLLRDVGLLDAQWRPVALDRMSKKSLREVLDQYFASRTAVWGDELSSLSGDSVPLTALLGSPATDKRIESVVANAFIYGRVYLSDPFY